MSLRAASSIQGKDVHLSLEGIIDENCVLPEFPDEIAGRLVINLEKIFMINSLGMRRWLKWLSGIRARAGIVLVRCSEPFISQMNVLHNFVPAGVTVESFQIPYPCVKCEHEDYVLFTVGKDSDAPDLRACSICGASVKVGVVKADYLNFLAKKSA